ncbi:MAG: helix-turn-helix transcriptional regulator [Methyloceanibacter sp.]
MSIAVVPFPAKTSGIEVVWPGSARPAAILFVNDREREMALRKDALQRRFGLTPAEADVAIEVARGDGRRASAQRLGVTVTTVRSHLTNIFAKTGIRRQGELVRLVFEHDDDSTACKTGWSLESRNRAAGWPRKRLATT